MPIKPKLVRPNIIYKKSFLQALREFRQEGGKFMVLDRRELERDFAAYVSKVKGWAQGRNLIKGYIPETVYWLVDGKKYIGKTAIRHRLTPFLRQIGGHIGYEIRPSERKKGYGSMILKLALPKARVLGIKKVRISCDAANVGSRRIIEKNGGVFDTQISQGRGLPKKLRFWINLK